MRLHGPWFEIGPRLGNPPDSRFRTRVEREGRAILAAAGVTAPSHHVLENAQNYYGTVLPRARVIPNPVELANQPWNRHLADPRRVLFIGRFDRLKGGDLMIDAFSRVLDAVPDAKLWFIGPDHGCPAADGRNRSLIEYVSERLPGALESGRVEWLGRQPLESLARFRRQSLLCIVCSLYETFSYTVVEAMALGCPIVASRAGGIPEVIQDGSNGLLHDPGDAGDLAGKIVSLIRDPDRAARLGRQAADDCRSKYESSTIAMQTAEFYRSLLADRKKH
ncbi:MAG: glycosyltransferase family 4 protein [Isosphaeraceae bacterium]